MFLKKRVLYKQATGTHGSRRREGEPHIAKVLSSFALIIAAGYLWRFFDPGGIDRHRLRHALSTAVLHAFLPALAFGLIATARPDRSFIAVPFAAAGASLAALAAGALVYRFVPWFRDAQRSAIGVLLLSAAFGNVMYLGLPVITGTLGERYGHIAILYDLLATTPILLTVGMLIAARYGSGASVSLGASLKRVLLLPPLWGVAAGLAASMLEFRVPSPVLDGAQLMGRAVIPVMTFTVGLALDFRDIRKLTIALPALAIKLFLAPFVAFTAGRLLGLGGGELRAVSIEGAMPVMVLSLVIADEFELDVQLAATCIAVSTAASFFTVPLMMRLLF